MMKAEAFVNTKIPSVKLPNVSVAENMHTSMDGTGDITSRLQMNQDSNLLAFLFRNNLIGEIISNQKAGFTRVARIVIFFTIFQAIITLSAVFYDVGLAWYTAGLTAAAFGVMIEPILTFLLYTGRE